MSLAQLLICLATAVAVLACGYLAGCAGAGRWLTWGEWWGRSTCAHSHGRLRAIEYDGEAVYECVVCGKSIRKRLS